MLGLSRMPGPRGRVSTSREAGSASGDSKSLNDSPSHGHKSVNCRARRVEFHGLASMATISHVPVYHFTFHAYRNWRPDHPRGYIPKGQGVQPADEEMAEQYDRNASQEPVKFDEQ